MGKFNVVKKQAILDDAKNEMNNNKKEAKFKGRHFFITQNDVSKSKKMESYIRNLKSLKFMLGCREIAPVTHHIHDHFYIQLKNSICITNSGCEYADIKHPKGTAVDNVAYLFKLEEPWKRGLIYTRFGDPTFFSNYKVEDIIDMTEEDIRKMPAGLFNAAEKIKKKYSSIVKASEIRKKAEIFYFWGDTYTLKSKYAIGIIAELKGDECVQLNGANGFLNGAQGLGKVAIYDEFRDTDMQLKEFIQLTDYNKQVINIKGNFIKNDFETIIFTSSQCPADLYYNAGGHESRGQWLRRIHSFHFGYDEEKNEYYCEPDDYTAMIEKRTCPEITKVRDIAYKNFDGSLLTDQQKADLNLPTRLSKPCIIDKFNEILEKKAKEEKEEKEEEVSKPISQSKQKKRKVGKKKKLPQSEKRLLCYKELKKPLDRLPDTEEKLRALITPPEDAIESDDDMEMTNEE